MPQDGVRAHLSKNMGRKYLESPGHTSQIKTVLRALSTRDLKIITLLFLTAPKVVLKERPDLEVKAKNYKLSCTEHIDKP